MTTVELKYSPEVVQLIESHEELVHAADIAPIVRMSPDRIIGYAKTGQWPREICNYVVTGRCVKFFRIDFLRKGGWIH
jgi:hypothetical protein